MTSALPAPRSEPSGSAGSAGPPRAAGAIGAAEPRGVTGPGELIVQGLVAPGVVGAAVVEAGVVEPVEVSEDAVSSVEVVAELRRLVGGPVHGPYDVGTVTELAAGPAGARPPLAVVGATASYDVAAVVEWAARRGVRVEVVGPGDTGWSGDAVVVTTRRMDRVVVDPDTGLAWLGAGVTWRHLLHAAADVGVVGPVGPDDDRGVIGTLLAGGRSVHAWVRGCTVVLPDGRVVDAERVGPGGIVTEMEIGFRG